MAGLFGPARVGPEARVLMVRELTKRKKKTGELYVRPKVVDAQIVDLLHEEPHSILGRAKITDHLSVKYLRSESLVYVIREALHRNDDTLAADYIKELFCRCERLLKSRRFLPDSLRPDAPQLR